jgi:hypothetical protein
VKDQQKQKQKYKNHDKQTQKWLQEQKRNHDVSAEQRITQDYAVPSTSQCSSFVHVSDLEIEADIATGHRFDGRSLIPGRGKRFFLLHSVQTGSEALPASYPMSTGDKAARAWS